MQNMLEEKDGLTKTKRGGLSHQGGLAPTRGFTDQAASGTGPRGTAP